MSGLAAFQVSAIWPHLLAGYCAILLPLVVGLPPIIAIMESVYVMTTREIWKQMARFWAVLLRISLVLATLGAVALLVLGVVDVFATGSGGQLPSLVLIGTILALLCVELALFARFTREDWFIPGVGHLANTWALVVVPTVALFAVAIVYGWMDNPAGMQFDAAGKRLRITDIAALLLNPAAQVKFVHLAAAAYTTAATCVLAISAWYLLRARNVRFARSSLTVAASFGLASALSLAVLGDANGYTASPGQQMQIAAIAAEWHTQPPPAAFTLIGLPDVATQTTHDALQVPGLLGIAATHSWRKPVAGIAELRAANADRIRRGAAALANPRPDPVAAHAPGVRNLAAEAIRDSPYGLLLLNHADDPPRASAATIEAAAEDTVPNVPLLFWTFRGMALLGAYCIALFGCAFWLASRRQLQRRAFLRIACWSWPVPWLAGGLGWLVSEAGRGPWLVSGMLPVVTGTGGWQAPAIVALAVLALAALAIIGSAWLRRVWLDGPDGLKYWAADSGPARRY